MNDWLNMALGAPAVLVTVAKVDGSGPREPGARMLVTVDVQHDTIGGGHLELRAVEIARAMLDMLAGDHPHQTVQVERFALGPGLGQCCGGVVYLAFEYVDASLAAIIALLQQRRTQDSWRITAIDEPNTAVLLDDSCRCIAGSGEVSTTFSATLSATFSRQRGTHLVRDESGRRWLVDAVLAPRAHLTLFGAGHVGAAIVRALADLPCTITWVDEREDMFPPQIPPNVRIEATDVPEMLVAASPPGGSFLVMTHSHALDQRLTEAIMLRPDSGWFGLIGSLTKRRQFEHRLAARGVSGERIAAMVCPIGMPGISNKAPAVIAASVCCQLLMVWEQQAKASLDAAQATPLKLVASSRIH